MAKKRFSPEDKYELTQLNNSVNALLTITKREEKLRQKEEKYQQLQKKEREKSKNFNNDPNRKKAEQTGGFFSDFFGTLKKIGVMFAVYKITEWIGDKRNTEKVRKLLVGVKKIFDFVNGFVNGVANPGESFSKMMKEFESNKVNKTLSDFAKAPITGIQSLIDGLTATTKTVIETPTNIGKSIREFLKNMTKSIGSAGDDGVKLASQQIKEGIQTLQPEPERTEKEKPEFTPEQSVEPPKPKAKPITEDKNETIPKLAKGGIVKKQTNKPSIKPLKSLLSGDTSNQKFNNDVKQITPKFEELLKLPFSVIGSGLVSMLKSAIKDNPSANMMISPVLNSIGRMFDVPVGDDNENILKINAPESDKSGVDISKYAELIGTKEPTISKGGNEFQSSNDTSVRGLLADILSALTSKMNPPKFASGGEMVKSGSGWIMGSQSGYPVSLDGDHTDFIGHGTEYVAKHKNKPSSFVVPIDTPHTRINKRLTKARIMEATNKGYELPEKLKKMSEGGEISGYEVYSGGRPTKSVNDVNVHHMNGRAYYKQGREVFRKDGGIPRLNKDLVLMKNGKSSVPIPSPVGGTASVKSERESGGYGNLVEILNEQNLVIARMAHLSKNLVRTGDKIKIGQIVGIQGNTGHSTGTHLHLELPQKSWQQYYNNLRSGKFQTTTISSNDHTSPTDPIEPTTASNDHTAPDSTPKQPEMDFLGIGNAFATIAQMLGVKPDTDKPTPIVGDKKKDDEQIKPTPKVVPIQKSNPIPNIKPVPKVAPIPKVAPTIIKGGDTNNVSNKSIASSRTFSFSSDANRFLALNSDIGLVEQPMFV
jgi:hypothetical protein